MQQTIHLNDDSELEVAWCGAAEGVLWVDGLNLTMMEALTIFSDKTKTSIVTTNPQGAVHEGYTNLIHISNTYDGLTKVALRKEA